MTDRMSSEPSFGSEYAYHDAMFDLQLHNKLSARRRDPAEVWITGAGEHMLISEMTGQHARNALRLIKRLAARGRVWRMDGEGKLVHCRDHSRTRFALTPWYNAASFCPPVDRPGWYLMRRRENRGRPPVFMLWGGREWTYTFDVPMRSELAACEWRGFERLKGEL
jgi:hypothetical protein